MNDKEVFQMMREKMYTGLVCDVMDELGYRNQAMSSSLRPLEHNSVVAGRAKTILAVDVYETVDEPYKMEIAALDSVKEGEVVVVCTNNSPNNGVWGELLSTATMMRGGTGAIIDGLIRDTKRIRELNFPIFSTGYRPVDSKGRGLVIDFDCPIVCCGVYVRPNDVIFGDFDGVAVIPHEIFDEVIKRALVKCSMENNTRDDLRKGKLLSDVYATYGVL